METCTALKKSFNTHTPSTGRALMHLRAFGHSALQRLDRLDVERLLMHGNAAERKNAAVVLGKLHSISSYQPLLTALQRKNNDRDTQIAILGALKNIGGKHSYVPEFAPGLVSLEAFVMAHLSDADLVKLACHALESTAGTFDEIDAVAMRIMAAAKGNKETTAAATSLYLTTISH